MLVRRANGFSNKCGGAQTHFAALIQMKSLLTPTTWTVSTNVIGTICPWGVPALKNMDTSTQTDIWGEVLVEVLEHSVRVLQIL